MSERYLIAVNGHALGELLLTKPIKVYRDDHNDATRINITSGETCLDIALVNLECNLVEAEFSERTHEPGDIEAGNLRGEIRLPSLEQQFHKDRIVRAATTLANSPHDKKLDGKLADVTCAYVLFLETQGRCPCCERKPVHGHDPSCPNYP